MAVPIPESHKRLFDEPVLANLATIMPDGRPQVNPVWCDYDGTYVRVNAAEDRQKSRNMQRRSFATILLVDPASPFFWMEVRGRVVRATKDGAVEHINGMAKKYTGRDVYTPVRENEVRVMYTIEPERVVVFGE
jgi:PPOX class probable F420-dependent enzyme